jgi:TRAP-type uncharacterized transport system substrate-binding protein
MLFNFRALLFVALLSMALPQLGGFAQSATPATGYATTVAPPYGIAAMRPVFAGACKACPWGILGKVTADALRPYGYEVQNCWVCWSSYGPRYMADKTVPVMLPPTEITNPELVEMPPNAVPDISATSESNLLDAWNGTGAYAQDHKQRRNYRVIASVQASAYMLAAASKKSGITSLWQIKDRKEPTWIAGGNNNSIVFKYYGITEEDLKAKGGGIMPPMGAGPGMISREKRASADVFIGTGLLVNTPEQRVWYEASQLNDLVFLDFDEALLVRMAQEPGYVRATLPLAILRGVDRPIPTVMRPNHFIYVRDDAPDSFAYAVAKALDEQRHLFREQAEAWYYDPATVAISPVIPLHPGALKYYRERGYIK